MTQQTTQMARAPRREQLRRAFFRGESLRLENPAYLNSVRTLLGELLSSDVGSGDLTVGCAGAGLMKRRARRSWPKNGE